MYHLVYGAPVRSEWSEFSLRVRPTKLKRFQAGTVEPDEVADDSEDGDDTAGYQRKTRKKQATKEAPYPRPGFNLRRKVSKYPKVDLADILGKRCTEKTLGVHEKKTGRTLSEDCDDQTFQRSYQSVGRHYSMEDNSKESMYELKDTFINILPDCSLDSGDETDEYVDETIKDKVLKANVDMLVESRRKVDESEVEVCRLQEFLQYLDGVNGVDGDICTADSDKMNISFMEVDNIKYRNSPCQLVPGTSKEAFSQIVNNGQSGNGENLKNFGVGSLVWAKFSKTRWWPAIVIDGRAANLQVARKGWTWLMWFGDHKLSEIRLSQVEIFSRNYRKRCAGKLPSIIEKAVVEALQVCAARIGVDLAGYNSVLKWGITGTDFLQVIQTMDSEEWLAPKGGTNLPTDVEKVLKQLREENSSSSENNFCTSLSAFGSPLADSSRGVGTGHHGVEKHNTDNSCQGGIMDVSLNKDVNFCLSCAKHDKEIVCRHPLFEGFLCLHCKDALMESLFALDDDGCNLFCCICGEGGELCVCETPDCGKSFCTSCMKHYLSLEAVKCIRTQSPWACFLCRPYDLATHGILIPMNNWQDLLIKFYNPVSEDTNLVNTASFVNNIPKRKLRVLSLFDGIGTVREALDQLGLDVDSYYASEINSDAEFVTIFNQGFSVCQLGDVYNINRSKLEEICPIDLVIGSPPVEDLDVSNPEYEGFNGTAVLMVKFLLLLKEIEMICKGSNFVYWLVESTAAMKSEFRKTLTKLFDKEPCMWDAQFFSPYVQPKMYWGNLPGLYSSVDYYQSHKDQLITLDSYLAANVNRNAVLTKLRNCGIDVNVDQKNKTENTNEDKGDNCDKEKKNIAKVTNPGTNFRLPVLMNGEETNIWIGEVERVLGFPEHYTDVSRLGVQQRQRLMKQASSIQVLKHLLSPLTQIFATHC